MPFPVMAYANLTWGGHLPSRREKITTFDGDFSPERHRSRPLVKYPGKAVKEA
jgi:hypothetical protein